MKLSPHDFLTKFMPFAIQSEADTGISKWVTLAQCAEESGWGAQVSGANNYFGIKSFDPKEPREAVTTFEFNKNPHLTASQIGLIDDPFKYPITVTPSIDYPGYFKYTGKSWFRSFSSIAEAFDAHAQVFFKNPVYSDALKVKDQPEQFVALMAVHYAASPGYTSGIISIMHSLQKITI